MQADSDSAAASVRREEAAELAAQVAGPVFLPGDDGYAAECVGYNLNLGLEPALIVGVRAKRMCRPRSGSRRSAVCRSL